jgi:exonuclease VII large subunit
VRDASGHLVIDSASVSKGTDLTVTLKKGELTTKVTSTNPKLS